MAKSVAEAHKCCTEAAKISCGADADDGASWKEDLAATPSGKLSAKSRRTQSS